MSATRSTGLLFMAAIIAAAAQNHIKDGGTLRGFFAGLWKRTDLLLAVALVPIGVQHLCGLPLVPFGRRARLPAHPARLGPGFCQSVLEPLAHHRAAVQERQFPTISTDLAFGLAAIFGMIMSVVMAWKGRWDWAIFSLFGVLLPLSTNAYSMLRFVVGIAPILIMSAYDLQQMEVAVLAAAAGASHPRRLPAADLDVALLLSDVSGWPSRLIAPALWHLIVTAFRRRFRRVVMWMMLNPRVDDDYRNYYIDRTWSCFPRLISHFYPLGEPVSFVKDRPGYERDTIRWCGFMPIKADGIKIASATTVS